MQVAIIGGKLQGIEASYLAAKAGWRTLLIDANQNAPASGICDRTVVTKVQETAAFRGLFNDIDLIIPALEDQAALTALHRIAKAAGIPLVYDRSAYAISSSKRRSNQIFEAMGLTYPEPFPMCDFPVLIKPDDKSGSQGIEIITDARMGIRRFMGVPPPTGIVAQAFIPGPMYSLEVIGRPGRYLTPQVTKLHLDERYDCKGITTPSGLPDTVVADFEQTAIKIAEALELTGIMDVEVIYDRHHLWIIEIDARLPSQTPTAVFWSTGTNMLSLLEEIFVNEAWATRHLNHQCRPVRYEHIRVSKNIMTLCGEHIMAQAEPVQIHSDFFGADEAISDYRPGKTNWVATLIHVADTPAELNDKRKNTFDSLRSDLGLTEMMNSTPKGIFLSTDGNVP